MRSGASGGFAFRNIWFDGGSGRFAASGRIDSTEPAVGAVFAAGVGFKAWFLKLAPEIRYTRWRIQLSRDKSEQVQALLGIAF